MESVFSVCLHVYGKGGGADKQNVARAQTELRTSLGTSSIFALNIDTATDISTCTWVSP